MLVFKRPWLSLVAAGVLVLAMLLGPALSGRLLIALLGSLIAGAVLALSLRRTEDRSFASSVGSDGRPVNPNSSTEIFALGKLFEATTSGMREGLLVIDSDMRVVASNQAAHQLFTLYEGKLESQRLTELTRQPAVYSAFLGALKGEERAGVKVETHGPDRRIFDLRVVPLKGVDGKSTQGAIGVFFDVTRLERLERVRQEFLSNVSHELRTPLTAILAFVETLESGALGDVENSQRFLSIIRRNANRMHTLIDDILELSAIEAGNVQVTSEEIELHLLVSEVFTSLAAGAAARQIVLDNRVDQKARVFADGRRLEQMLTNLVDNAIKFNRDGGRVTVVQENGARDRILVEDTGEGIPAQHLPRIFERFYRVDRARSRDMGGTGLGLAIVKHLARAHGGDVAVDSKLGEGSTFVIELPRTETNAS
jgi:two-component system, OmpR family, phosphate regulon sensor histidine kinase PhoR